MKKMEANYKRNTDRDALEMEKLDPMPQSIELDQAHTAGEQSVESKIDEKSKKSIKKYHRQIEWKVVGIIMSLLALFGTIGQLALFDLFFVKYGNIHTGLVTFMEDGEIDCSHLHDRNADDDLKEDIKLFYYWLVPDLIAVAAMVFIPVVHITQFIKLVREKHVLDESSLIPTLKYAWLIWLIYSCILVAKIVVGTEMFLRTLQYYEDCNAFKSVGVNTFILMLCLSTLIFLCMVSSYHTDVPLLKNWLNRLIEKVTFNILDAVHLLMVLFADQTLENIMEDSFLETVIVGLACIVYILPTFSLVRVHQNMEQTAEKIDNNNQVVQSIHEPFEDKTQSTVLKVTSGKVPKSKHRRRMEHLLEGDFYTLVFMLLVNVPFLVIRCHLWHFMKMELSIFLLKNVMEIVLATKDLAFSLRLMFKTIN